MNAVAVVDPITGIAHMLSHPFMAYAFVAGTAIALASGFVGNFVVLRQQTFAGDALSHVAFTGALAALAAGVDLRVGLFGGCVVVALGMGLLGKVGRADDVVIGNLFAWLLGLGVLFLAIYTTARSGSDSGVAGTTVLFGSVFGLSLSSTVTTAVIGVAAALAMVVIGRPLAYASLDEGAAAAAGVPVRALGVGFLVLIGVVAAEATEVVGALLLLGLLATPSAAVLRLVPDPVRAMWWSGACTVASVWVGLVVSYGWPAAPPSFSIIAVATALRVGVTLFERGSSARHRVRDATPTVVPT